MCHDSWGITNILSLFPVLKIYSRTFFNIWKIISNSGRKELKFKFSCILIFNLQNMMSRILAFSTSLVAISFYFEWTCDASTPNLSVFPMSLIALDIKSNSDYLDCTSLNSNLLVIAKTFVSDKCLMINITYINIYCVMYDYAQKW